MKYTTPAERIAELVAEHGSYRRAAEALEIGHVYLYRVACGQRSVSPKLLEKIGLEKQVRYLRTVA